MSRVLTFENVCNFSSVQQLSSNLTWENVYLSATHTATRVATHTATISPYTATHTQQSELSCENVYLSATHTATRVATHTATYAHTLQHTHNKASCLVRISTFQQHTLQHALQHTLQHTPTHCNTHTTKRAVL